MQNTDLNTLGEMLLQNEEAASLTAGCSMRPMLREHKDVVVIKRVDAPLKKGDAVVYPNNNGQYVLHRIIRIKGDTLIIRGDNNDFIEKVPKDQVVGVLKEFYRGGKFYDCEKSVGYKIYVKCLPLFYPFQCIWKKLIKPILVKIKHKIFK